MALMNEQHRLPALIWTGDSMCSKILDTNETLGCPAVSMRYRCFLGDNVASGPFKKNH